MFTKHFKGNKPLQKDSAGIPQPTQTFPSPGDTALLPRSCLWPLWSHVCGHFSYPMDAAYSVPAIVSQVFPQASGEPCKR